jgi:hypothetical protein
MARFGVGVIARQMAPDSRILKNLRSQPNASPTIAIWTPDNAIILPPESGKLIGTDLVAVPGYTHLAVVEAPTVELVILRAVARVT